jgi:hypothetical protein
MEESDTRTSCMPVGVESACPHGRRLPWLLRGGRRHRNSARWLPHRIGKPATSPDVHPPRDVEGRALR